MIRWTKRTLKQFEAIQTYIAKDSPRAARKQCSIILQAITRLDTFPISGRVGEVSATRELVVSGTQYIVYYRVVDGVIFLKAIRHAARQKPSRFSK